VISFGVVRLTKKIDGFGFLSKGLSETEIPQSPLHPRLEICGFMSENIVIVERFTVHVESVIVGVLR
jgi:hypothetical protein